MIALLLVASVLLQLSTQQEVPGILQKRPPPGVQAARRSLSPTANETCDGTRMFSTCAGCDMVSVCLGNTMDWRHCPYVTPDKPYCNNGECSATPSFDAYCPPSIFCTGAGYYPDATTCEIYHFCESKHSMSLVYKCPSNYVFNPETSFCKRKQKVDDCMKLQCNSSEIFTRYGSSQKYFGYCRFNGEHPYQSEIFRCPEGTHFDGKSCAFQCPAEGRFPDATDARTYYECYYSGELLTADMQVCPFGRVFDAKLFVCVTDMRTTSTTPYWPKTDGTTPLP